LTGGSFSALNGHLDAGTSTLRFTGMNQSIKNFYGLTLYNVENLTSGSTLTFTQSSLFLNKYTAAPGTTNLLTVNSFTLNELDLQGTEAEPIVFKSRIAGDDTRLIFNGLQNIAWTTFQDINASETYTVDAGDNCTDGGNNRNVNFGGLIYWTGADPVDNNWSTPGNWSTNTVPTTGQAVVFNDSGDPDCYVDMDISLGALNIDSSYTGTVNFQEAIVTMTGNLTLDNFDAGTSTFIFTGENCRFVKSTAAPLYNLENRLADTSLFILSHIIVNKFTADAGTDTIVSYGGSITCADLLLEGTAGSPVTFKASQMNRVTKLNLTVDVQSVAYTVFKGVDASGGEAINAVNNCIDLGYNSNINFGHAVTVAAFADIVIPATSAVSPLFVEGTSSASVTVTTDASSFAEHVDGNYFFANVPLSSAAATSITLNEFENADSRKGDQKNQSCKINLEGVLEPDFHYRSRDIQYAAVYR